MLDWMKRRRPARHQALEADAANAEGSLMSRKSAPLYKYLDERYADAVVLTFAEIEDLVGCERQRGTAIRRCGFFRRLF
jgi:hypothetical protein